MSPSKSNHDTARSTPAASICATQLSGRFLRQTICRRASGEKQQNRKDYCIQKAILTSLLQRRRMVIEKVASKSALSDVPRQANYDLRHNPLCAKSQLWKPSALDSDWEDAVRVARRSPATSLESIPDTSLLLLT